MECRAVCSELAFRYLLVVVSLEETWRSTYEFRSFPPKLSTQVTKKSDASSDVRL